MRYLLMILLFLNFGCQTAPVPISNLIDSPSSFASNVVWDSSTRSAYVTSISINPAGAKIYWDGKLRGLRYTVDSVNWLNLYSPFPQPYIYSNSWPEGSNTICVQARGTDGYWTTKKCASITISPPPPPPTYPAFVSGITTSSTGATLNLIGPVQSLRYSYDSSGSWVNLTAPFNSPYTINFNWPVGTTFACAQAQGTDGLWNGPTTTDPQTCNSVVLTPPQPVPRTASWNAVTTDALGQPITVLGYYLYYTDVQGDWSRNPRITVLAPATSYIINNLVSGKTYYFAVTAYDANGESTKSQTFTFTQP